MKQTKIVASISDRRCDVEFLRKLFFAGMNVVRMNTAHATPDGIRNIIKNVRTVSPHLALMIDTKGPEVRTTGCAEPIEYKTGDVVKIFGRPGMDSSHDIVNVSYIDFAKDVKVGDHVLFDDGELDMLVIENDGPMLVAQVQNDGVLGAHKSVYSCVYVSLNVVAISLSLDSCGSLYLTTAVMFRSAPSGRTKRRRNMSMSGCGE